MQIICKYDTNKMHDELMTLSRMNIVTESQFLNFVTASLKKQTSLELLTTTFIPTERSIKHKSIHSKIIVRSYILWYLQVREKIKVYARLHYMPNTIDMCGRDF